MGIACQKLRVTKSVGNYAMQNRSNLIPWTLLDTNLSDITLFIHGRITVIFAFARPIFLYKFVSHRLSGRRKWLASARRAIRSAIVPME